MRLTATLVADGSSDSLLKPILEWLLDQHLPTGSTLNLQVPEWGRLPDKISVRTLPEKLLAARLFFTAPIYFVHRDVEKDGTWEGRSQEIDQAIQRVFKSQPPPYVRVIPVQMTEAWLLHDEEAIRKAAENPSGRDYLPLPSLHELETQKHAKTILLTILRDASGLSGRKLQKFEAYERRRLYRLAALQQEKGFAVLRALPAFRILEQEVVALVAAWQSRPST